MKLVATVLTGVALLAFAQAAQAVPAKVAGTYALMIFTHCEARLAKTTGNYLRSPTVSGPAVASLNLSDSGEINIGVGSLTFPATAATSGTANLEAFLVSGGSLRLNATGEAMETHPEAVGGTFAVTETTFTFDPADDLPMVWTYRAADVVVSSGLAKTLHMVRREDARCVNSVTATKR